MANFDYGLFIKVLSRTQSSHDPEVLVAIKKANEMLAKAGLQWHQVIVMLHNNRADYSATGRGREFEQDFNTDALHRAAEAARARNFGDDLRKRQAQRDAAYASTQAYGDYYGWTTKGPGDFESDHKVYSQEPDAQRPTDEEIELRARDQTESISGEAAQTNWFCFAMVEPEIAEWLFKLREGHAFHRILFAQVCDHGELHDNQLQVCRQMMMRDQRSTPR